MDKPFEIGERIYYLGIPMVVVDYEYHVEHDVHWLVLHYFAQDRTLRTLEFPPGIWYAIKAENDRAQADIKERAANQPSLFKLVFPNNHPDTDLN